MSRSELTKYLNGKAENAANSKRVEQQLDQCEENIKKWEQIRTVLEMYQAFFYKPQLNFFSFSRKNMCENMPLGT